MKLPIPIFVITASLALSGLAQACQCLPSPAPKIGLENSAAVFAGKVASIQVGERQKEVGFKVSKSWKGVSQDTISVLTNNDSAACGINFKKDKEYIVYAFKLKDDERLQTNLCTRTALLENAAEDLADLGEPLTEIPAPEETVVQLNPTFHIGNMRRPLTQLNETLAKDQTSTRFRSTWEIRWLLSTFPKISGDSGYATALYNRKKGTLALYSRTVPNSDLTRLVIQHKLYAGVTEAMLEQLAAKYSNDKLWLTSFSCFDLLSELGASETDLGSKIVVKTPRVSRPH